MSGFKRRRFLVGKAQYRLLLFNLGYYVVFTAAFSAALWTPLILGIQDETIRPEKRGEMAAMLLHLHSRLVPVGLLLMFLFGIHSVLISHRIVGPLVRFKHMYRQIAGGDLTGRVHLRKRDYLHDESAELNEMIDGLSARLLDVKEGCDALQAEWRASRMGTPDGSGTRTVLAEHRLRSMDEHLTALEAAWTRLHLPSHVGGAADVLEQLPAALPNGSRRAIPAVEGRGDSTREDSGQGGSDC